MWSFADIAMSTVVVACQSISKAYPGVLACRGVSAEFRAGEVHALLGENGAGKSTLVKILAGIFPPDGGTLEVNGRPARFPSPGHARRAGISVVHQLGSLIDTLTVAENLQLANVLHPALGRPADGGPSHRPGAHRLADACARIAPGRLARGLSPSERKVVEIYRALVMGTSVLVLDEPTATLAPQESEWLFQHLKELAAAGYAVVVVSHKLPEVVKYSDRFTLLRHGQVVARLHSRTEVTAQTVAELMFASTAHNLPPNAAARASTGTVVHPPRQTPVGAAELVVPSGESDTGSPRVLESETGRVESQVLDYIEGLQRTGIDARAPLAEEGRQDAAKPLLPDTPLVRLCGVSTKVNSPHEASLHDLSFDFFRGQVVGIAGRPGCGVVTLFDLLAGRSVRMTGGGVVWGGNRLRSVGVIAADGRSEGSIDELTVAENLALRRRELLGWRRWFGGRLRAFAQGLIERFDIRPRSPDMLAGQLSGGNRQKMILARELTHAKDLVLATNPTSGLDVAAARFVREALKDKAREGCCVVVYSEDLDELAALADRVCVLSRGRVVLNLTDADGVTPERLGRALTELDAGSLVECRSPARELPSAKAAPTDPR